jgi:transcriptional activator of cad operon
VALVALSTIESRPPVNKARLLLNPRDIDIHLLKGNSCTNWYRSTRMRWAWAA